MTPSVTHTTAPPDSPTHPPTHPPIHPSHTPLQALVGLAFGPVGSNACIEHDETADSPPWRDGEPLHLAVVLGSTDDAVRAVQPPLPLCPAVSSLSPSGDASWWGAAGGAGGGGSGFVGAAGRGPEWLSCVRESMELMSAVLSRELPATFVAKELLPKVS